MCLTIFNANSKKRAFSHIILSKHILYSASLSKYDGNHFSYLVIKNATQT